MLEFSGKNFQCWPDFKITVDGLTLVVGPSNHGKSAIVRALKGLFRNEISAASVKEGATETELTLASNSDKIEFERSTKGSAHYKINGKLFKKLAGGIPPGIDDMGFSEVQIGTFKFDPIFAGQFDAPFLLGSGPQELNAILGAFASTEKLEIGKKTAASRVASKNQEAKALASEIGDAEVRRSRLEELQAKVEAVADTLKPLEQEAALLSNLAVCTRGSLIPRRELERLKNLLDRLALPDVQDVENTAVLLQAVGSILGARCALKQTRSALAALDYIQTAWTDVVGDYRVYAGYLSASDGRDNVARETAKAVNFVIGEAETVLTEAADLQARIKALRETLFLWDVVDKAHRDMVANALECDLTEEKVIKLQEEIDEEARAAALVECPKCHHKFNPNQEQHSHG